MVMFMRTAVVAKSTAMDGSAVATTVESSICMNSAHPTMKGIIRCSRGGLGRAVEAASGPGRALCSGIKGTVRTGGCCTLGAHQS
ncbi:hypothetical protein CDEF62S_05600 [Castellaniella defragrans]